MSDDESTLDSEDAEGMAEAEVFVQHRRWGNFTLIIYFHNVDVVVYMLAHFYCKVFNYVKAKQEYVNIYDTNSKEHQSSSSKIT